MVFNLVAQEFFHKFCLLGNAKRYLDCVILNISNFISSNVALNLDHTKCAHFNENDKRQNTENTKRYIQKCSFNYSILQIISTPTARVLEKESSIINIFIETFSTCFMLFNEMPELLQIIKLFILFDVVCWVYDIVIYFSVAIVKIATLSNVLLTCFLRS